MDGGADPASATGLTRAREARARGDPEGVDWLLARLSCPAIVFEATSASVHVRNAPRYQAAGIRDVDLTPAARVPSSFRPVNLARSRRCG